MRIVIVLALVIIIAMAGYLIFSKEEQTPEEVRREKVEKAVEDTKAALQGASDSLNDAVKEAADAAELMAIDLQAQMEDAFNRTNEAVESMSEDASNALHDAVDQALEDAAVIISEKSDQLKTATNEVREQIRVVTEEALIKAAEDIADGTATIEQAAQQMKKTIADKTAQIE